MEGKRFAALNQFLIHFPDVHCLTVMVSIRFTEKWHGSHGLSVKGTQYVQSLAGLKGHQLEVGAQRDPKILAHVYLLTSYLGE